MPELLSRDFAGIDELFHAQLRGGGYDDAVLRTWLNVMQMYPHLPTGPRVDQQLDVLDLGCGTGRVVVGLSRLWAPHATYWPADGDNTGDIGRHQWGVKAGDKGFYNRFELMKQYVTSQVDNVNALNLSEPDWWRGVSPADIMVSMYAVGTHYPLNTYQSIYKNILKDNALVMFTHDQRTGDIPDYFHVELKEQDNWKRFKYKKSHNDFVVARYRP